MQNKDLFASKDSELGHTETVKMHIDVSKNDPLKMRPYRTPMKNREVIDKAIDEMLDADVIRRSRSPWSFPVVIVDKEDGSKRFCVDLKRLNKISKNNFKDQTEATAVIFQMLHASNDCKYLVTGYS